MKTKSILKTLLTALAILAVPVGASAQLNIRWSTVDGGGGQSSGGAFTLRGTIGQPDANQVSMTGGGYSLAGGFWSLHAVQTPGAPTLRIFVTVTNTAVVAWPAANATWTLVENTDLRTTSWTHVDRTVNTVGSECQVIINPPAGNRFFKLQQP